MNKKYKFNYVDFKDINNFKNYVSFKNNDKKNYILKLKEKLDKEIERWN